PGHRIIDEYRQRRCTGGGKRTNSRQALFAPRASVAVAVRGGLQLVRNLVAVREGLRGLGQGLGRIGGALDYLSLKTAFGGHKLEGNVLVAQPQPRRANAALKYHSGAACGTRTGGDNHLRLSRTLGLRQPGAGQKAE